MSNETPAVVEFPYSETLVELRREHAPSAKFDRDSKIWRMPQDETNAFVEAAHKALEKEGVGLLIFIDGRPRPVGSPTWQIAPSISLALIAELDRLASEVAALHVEAHADGRVSLPVLDDPHMAKQSVAKAAGDYPEEVETSDASLIVNTPKICEDAMAAQGLDKSRFTDAMRYFRRSYVAEVRRLAAERIEDPAYRGPAPR